MKKIFYEGAIDKRNGKALFEFLNNHFTYYTMNSWNGLKSIANNVKLYNLQLEGDKWLALGLIQNDDYETINNMIYDWEDEHPNYEVGFNGSSGGYLVLTNKDDNINVIPNWISDFDNYEDFKQNVKGYYETVKNCLDDLNYYVELVQSFDKLCDDIRDYVNELSKIDKDKLLEDEIHKIVEDFNEDYKDDLSRLGIKPLEVNEDEEGYYIDLKELTKSLNDCFENGLYTYSNAISLFEVEWNDDYTILRLEYVG